MHAMQKASRQMSMAMNAPPPAAPMMMYTSCLLSIILPPGTVASVAIFIVEKRMNKIMSRSTVTLIIQVRANHAQSLKFNATELNVLMLTFTGTGRNSGITIGCV